MANYDSTYTGAQIDTALGYANTLNTHKIPATTAAIFYQDTAPTTWTIDNTLDDKLLFITKGSAASGETGGGEHSTGTWTQPNHTHTYTDIVNHVHPINTYVITGLPYSTVASTSSVGGVGASVDTSNPTGGAASGTTAGGATANTWRPAAYCAIICTKDAYS